MAEPDREDVGGPVVAQPPIISNYGLVVTVYILYLVGFLTGIYCPCRCNNCLSAKRHHGSGVAIAFSVSDKNVLNWIILFFRRFSDTSYWNRRDNLILVDYLDGG
jgi:hypothetical protein